MRLLSLLASAFVWLLSRSTAGVTRLLGLRKSDSKVTEEEIRSIIQEGAEDGEVQEVEQKIMGRVFSLGDQDGRVNHDLPQRTGMDRHRDDAGTDP